MATALFVTVAAALPHLFTAAVRVNAEAGDATWATDLAAQKLEELAARPFSELSEGEWVDYLDRSGRLVGGADAMPPAYTRRWTVAGFAPVPADALAITVAVSRHREGDHVPGAPWPRTAAQIVTLRARTEP